MTRSSKAFVLIRTGHALAQRFHRYKYMQLPCGLIRHATRRVDFFKFLPASANPIAPDSKDSYDFQIFMLAFKAR